MADFLTQVAASMGEAVTLLLAPSAIAMLLAGIVMA